MFIQILQELWFCIHSLCSRLEQWGHVKELHEADFWNTSICCLDSVWEKCKFVYFIFVKYWRYHSKIFHCSVFCSFHMALLMKWYFWQNFQQRFSTTQYAQSIAKAPLLFSWMHLKSVLWPLALYYNKRWPSAHSLAQTARITIVVSSTHIPTPYLPKLGDINPLPHISQSFSV